MMKLMMGGSGEERQQSNRLQFAMGARTAVLTAERGGDCAVLAMLAEQVAMMAKLIVSYV